MVETADGQRPIETIAPGDLVVGRDEYTGEQGLYSVGHTTVRPEQPILALEFVSDGSHEVLEVTGEHPIWARDSGWVAARDLLPGDEVFTSAGGWLRVSSGTWLTRSQTVYNLDVEEADSYFVGERGVWVHNNPICPPASRGGATPSAGPLTNRSGDLGTAAQRARTLNPRSSSFNANDLHHVFGRGGHNLEGVVQTFGSRNAAMEAMQNAVQAQAWSGGISGVFETGIRIGGHNVTVRGRVIDGIARIGTAFSP